MMNYLLDLSSNLFNTFSSISIEDNKEKEDSTEQVLMDISEESSSLTSMFMNYKEIKWLANKTGIEAKYFVYFIFSLLLLIMIQYFSNLTTLLIGVVYPIRQSMHELRLSIKNTNKEGTRKWMQYWVVFFLFINVETIFGKFLTQIPMYLFYKIVFLLINFLPCCNGANYFYNAFLKPSFQLYERQLYKMISKIYRKITQKFFVS